MANAPGLGPLLLLVGLIILLVSPQKMKTLGRMLLAFVGVAAVILMLGALLRKGDPELIGAFTGQIALGVADVLGLFHVLRLKRSRQSQP
jgi:hypothetical protein